MLRASVSRSLFQFFAELSQYVYRYGVYSVVVVAVFWEIALDIKVFYKTALAVDRRDFCILDS